MCEVLGELGLIEWNVESLGRLAAAQEVVVVTCRDALVLGPKFLVVEDLGGKGTRAVLLVADIHIIVGEGPGARERPQRRVSAVL